MLYIQLPKEGADNAGERRSSRPGLIATGVPATGVPHAVKMFVPGGPGVPARAKYQWVGVLLMKPLTLPLRLNKPQLQEYREQECSWNVVKNVTSADLCLYALYAALDM
eukprot:4705961-Amphidinium_carterae.1